MFAQRHIEIKWLVSIFKCIRQLYCNIFVTYLFLKHPSLTSTYVFVTRLFGNNGPQQVNKSPPKIYMELNAAKRPKMHPPKLPQITLIVFFHASTDVFLQSFMQNLVAWGVIHKDLVLAVAASRIEVASCRMDGLNCQQIGRLLLNVSWKISPISTSGLIEYSL